MAKQGQEVIRKGWARRGDEQQRQSTATNRADVQSSGLARRGGAVTRLAKARLSSVGLSKGVATPSTAYQGIAQKT